jgi:hypothetical protein
MKKEFALNLQNSSLKKAAVFNNVITHFQAIIVLVITSLIMCHNLFYYKLFCSDQ